VIAIPTPQSLAPFPEQSSIIFVTFVVHGKDGEKVIARRQLLSRSEVGKARIGRQNVQRRLVAVKLGTAKAGHAAQDKAGRAAACGLLMLMLLLLVIAITIPNNSSTSSLLDRQFVHVNGPLQQIGQCHNFGSAAPDAVLLHGLAVVLRRDTVLLRRRLHQLAALEGLAALQKQAAAAVAEAGHGVGAELLGGVVQVVE